MDTESRLSLFRDIYKAKKPPLLANPLPEGMPRIKNLSNPVFFRS